MTRQPALLRYPGAKWALGPRIAAALPEHKHYVEPYFGSGAVFFTKPASLHEVVNDIDGRVVNFWRTLREHTEELCWLIEATPWSRSEYEASRAPSDDPIEDARRFAVRAWQAHAADFSRVVGWRHRGVAKPGSGMSARWTKVPGQLAAVAHRLAVAEIEQIDAVKLVRRVQGEDVLIYADPPYPLETRVRGLYAVEVDRDHHVDLLDALRAHSGPVVLSGYACKLYDDALAGWHREEIPTTTHGGRQRTEVIWRNHQPTTTTKENYDE